MEIICKSTGEVATTLAAYTSTKHFRLFISDYRKGPFRNKGCHRCGGKTKTLFVWHKHTHTLGQESPDDMEALCFRCRKVPRMSLGGTFHLDHQMYTSRVYVNFLKDLIAKPSTEETTNADL